MTLEAETRDSVISHQETYHNDQRVAEFTYAGKGPGCHLTVTGEA